MGAMTTADRLRINGQRLEALGKAQRERFEADFARIYAAEQQEPEPDETVTDFNDRRGR
jgi:hypothetical protein